MARFEETFEILTDEEAETLYQDLEAFLDGKPSSALVDRVFGDWCLVVQLADSLLVKSTAFPQAALRHLLRRTRSIREAEHAIAQNALNYAQSH